VVYVFGAKAPVMRVCDVGLSHLSLLKNPSSAFDDSLDRSVWCWPWVVSDSGQDIDE
jgi:hypothetical protein